MSPVGLGDEDPFARREKASEAFLPTPEPPDDEDETPSDQAKHNASNSASNTASLDTGKPKEGKPVSTGTATEADLPPPPPAREPVGRVQFNQRILSDRRKSLDRYRRQHGATWQGLFDQMVDEYLDRRGLLPRDADQQ